MAYCKKCGAYIPDGQTKCLACGYDEAAADTAAQYAYSYDEEPAERDYKAERARQQEENRKWAREEYARRKKEQEEREAEERAKKRGYDPERRSPAGMTYTEGNSKFFAIASYVSLGFLLQKLFLPDDQFSEFHSRQGKRLFICGMAAELVGKIFGISWIVFLLRLGFTLRGATNANQGKEEELPFINNLFKK